MYPMFKRSPRYVLMIVIMAIGMMMSSMVTFASHGTNGLTGYEMNLHDAEVTMSDGCRLPIFVARLRPRTSFTVLPASARSDRCYRQFLLPGFNQLQI